MTEDEIKALKAKRQARLERAIQPQGSGYARRRITTPAQARPIDWNYYRHKPKVEPWEACALALNINPNSLILTTDGMGAFGSGIVTFKGLPNDEAADSFLKLLQLLNANQTENFAMGVRLSEFAAWCAPIVRDITGHDIPQELAALAVSAKLPQATGESGDAAGKVKAGTGTTPAPVTRTNKLRRNNLDPAIEKAIKQAGNMELADVYLELKELAISGEKPFTGEVTGDVLHYTNDENNPDTLSKEQLRKRLDTRKRNAV